MGLEERAAGSFCKQCNKRQLAGVLAVACHYRNLSILIASIWPPDEGEFVGGTQRLHRGPNSCSSWRGRSRTFALLVGSEN